MYAKLSSLSTRCPKERATHMQRTVFTLEIENNSYYKELVSHPMPEC